MTLEIYAFLLVSFHYGWSPTIQWEMSLLYCLFRRWPRANIVDSIAAENNEVLNVGDFNVDLIKKSTSESKANTSFNGFSANG